MKTLQILLFALLAATLSLNTLAGEKKQKPEDTPPQKSDDTKCQAPGWAIAIGHEEMWKKHNGCEEKKGENK